MLASPKNQNGVSLIEVLVSLGIIMILIVGIYSLIIFSLKINNDNKAYVVAMEIANQKMEEIRNLPYDDVGTVGGSPPGIVPQNLVINRNGEFNVYTAIMFNDDPYDGTSASGTDTIINDYKIVTITVSWLGSFGKTKKVVVFSKVIPNTEETLEGYGLLKLIIVDSNGSPVQAATIQIKNSSPFLDATYFSAADGTLNLPLLPDIEGYEVTVSKSGFSTDKTYTRDATNPNPSKPHLSIFQGAKTEESFAIDTLGSLIIHTVSNTLPNNWQVDSTPTSTDDLYPRVKRDSADNLYFAWQNDTATSSTVFIQKYDITTLSKQWSTSITVATTTFQKHPDIAVAASGNSFVVWQDNSTVLKLLAKIPPKNIFTNTANRLALISDFNEKSLLSPPKINDFFQVLNPKYSTPSFVYKIKELFLNSLKPKRVLALGESVSFVSMSSGVTTGSTHSITLQLPPNTQDGDFLLAFLHNDDYSDGPLIPPAGWNTLTNDMNPTGWSSDSRGHIFWKFAAGEPSSYTFNLSGYNEQKAGHIRAYRYVDPAGPFDGALEMTTTPVWNSLHPAPGHTVNNDGSMLVCGWGADTTTFGGNNPTFPAGMLHTKNNFADHITAMAADLPVDTIDSPTGSKILNANQTVTRASADWCLVLKPAPALDYVTFSATGTQVSSMLIPGENYYLGGSFVATENNVSRYITDIKISETGTIDAATDISAVKLFYDEDTTAPYDCGDQTFNPGTDLQFGTATIFDAPNGSANFSEVGGVEVTTTKSLCFYVSLSISSSTAKDDTLAIEISNPNTDVLVDSGSVEPNSAVAVNGITYLLSPAITEQIHYRWRYDDGNENNASWKEFEDTPTTITKNTNLRLRLEITNTGSFSTEQKNFTLEYGRLTTACEDISTWYTVPTDSSGAWQIIDSPFLNDSATTSNIVGGLSDENSEFLPGEIKDTTNIGALTTLSEKNFSEYEYNLIATNNALDATYCFRLTNNGDTSSTTYSVYPQASIVGDYNIYIRSFDNTGSPRWDIKKVNITSLDKDQINPHIAITSSNTNSATSVIVWEDYRNGNYDIYAQSFDDDGNRLWGSDLQITSSSTKEYSPAVTIDSFDNIYIVWTNNGISKDIYGTKLDLAGNKLWTSDINLTATSADAYDPAIVEMNGYLYFSWTNEVGAIKNPYIAKFASSGVAVWQKTANAEYSSADQFATSLDVDSSWLYVTWTDRRFENNDIFAQKFSLNGLRQWTEDYQLNINLFSTTQEYPTIVLTSGGASLAAWQDNRNGGFDIYATKFSDPNALSAVADVPLIITGTKRIGEDPVIYKFNQHISTDNTGYATIPIEWDVPGYSVEINPASSSLNIIFRDPIQPLKILAGETVSMDVYVE